MGECSQLLLPCSLHHFCRVTAEPVQAAFHISMKGSLYRSSRADKAQTADTVAVILPTQ